jgi:hypothetical protein
MGTKAFSLINNGDETRYPSFTNENKGDLNLNFHQNWWFREFGPLLLLCH